MIDRYPDLFEHDGQYYMTETDKITARIHKFDRSLVEGLFAQGTASGQPQELAPIYSSGRSNPPHHIANPLELHGKQQYIDITEGDSLTVEAWINPVPEGAPARPVLACGKTNGTGLLFHLFAPGGKGRALAALFRGTNTNASAHALATEQIAQLGKASGAHHVVMVVDGDAEIVSFLVDGVMLDGSDELGTGFVELAPLNHPDHSQSSRLRQVYSLEDFDGLTAEAGQAPAGTTDCMVGAAVRSLRVYGSKRGSIHRGFLRTSEVVASFRDGPPSASASISKSVLE